MKARPVLFAIATTLVVICLAPSAWVGLNGLMAKWRLAQEARWEEANMFRERKHNLIPPQVLPARPGDRSRFPRSSFSVSFVDGHGFGVDTGAGTVTYDRIMDPDTTLRMPLTSAQLDTLYEDALRDRMLEMPPPARIGVQWAGGEGWGGTLTVRCGGVSNALRWDPWTMNVRWSDDHKRLNAYVSELERMVKSLPAYRAMPRPKGNYID